jgi:hypothetical protein
VLLTAAAALQCLLYTSTRTAAAAAAAEGPAAAALPVVLFIASVCPMLALLLAVIIYTRPAGVHAAGKNRAAVGGSSKAIARQ